MGWDCCWAGGDLPVLLPRLTMQCGTPPCWALMKPSTPSRPPSSVSSHSLTSTSESEPPASCPAAPAVLHFPLPVLQSSPAHTPAPSPAPLQSQAHLCIRDQKVSQGRDELLALLCEDAEVSKAQSLQKGLPCAALSWWSELVWLSVSLYQCRALGLWG